MWAEARGESLNGMIAIGNASINRSKITQRDICKIKGVTRKPIDNELKPYVLALAEAILKSKVSNVSLADSWEKDRTPKYAGKIISRIQNHTFYISKRLN